MADLDPRSLGELGLVRALRRRVGRVQAPWRLGIGDDAAVLRPRSGQDLVVTTDTLVENVHFRWTTTDGYSLGGKALAVNLSDLAAMGARPLGFLLSLTLPMRAPGARVDALLRGLLAEAAASGCPLVGGDTTAGGSWVLTPTVFGEVRRGTALRRAGARPGDRLCVTGELGAAALGLELLERGRTDLAGAAPFVRRQLRPRPQLGAGQRLARAAWARAAIDLSDGLALDLQRLLEESGVGADVHLERLPLRRGMRRLCQRLGLAAEPLALHGGEDYELLFCVAADAPPAAGIARRLGCAVHEIGILRRGRRARYLRGGVRVQVPPRGFEHFKPISPPSE